MQNIKWYPGHIAKAKLELKDNLKMCDTVIEVIDSRAPFASKNKELEKYVRDKKRVLILNKSDLVKRNILSNLEKHFKNKYHYVVSVSAKRGDNIKRVFQILDDIYSRKVARFAKKRVRALPIRAMILGIPNVGKSRIINSLTGRKVVGVANEPGFTRGKKWIKILKNVELLDTPGILWFNNSVNERNKLMIIGAMKDKELMHREAAIHFVDIVSKNQIELAYDIKLESKTSEEILDELAAKINDENIERKIIKDFNQEKFGQLSLESA